MFFTGGHLSLRENCTYIQLLAIVRFPTTLVNCELSETTPLQFNHLAYNRCVPTTRLNVTSRQVTCLRTLRAVRYLECPSTRLAGK